MGNVIRCMLNPIDYDRAPATLVGTGYEEPYGDDHRSAIIDDANPFIPVLTNSLLSLSGWPDLAPETYTSPQGIAKEAVSWIDGRPNNYSTFDLTANFANMEGNPLRNLFAVWLEYATRVAEGSMLPFPVNIVENRVDYQTRIYRIILDSSRRFVQEITATGASFPIAVPIGANANFTSETPLTDASNQISIPFRCMGAIYDDPILILEFNRTVTLANVNMTDANRSTRMRKVNDDDKQAIAELQLFNYKCYPYISDDMELEWWVDSNIYDAVYKLVTTNN